MNRWLALILAAGLLLAACQEDEEPWSRAYVATSPDQLIGGDVALARVGDLILENDRIRVAILGKEASPGPGIFGGTLVDADLQRTDARFRGGNGLDSLSDIFPFVNLLNPRPGEGDISIVADGADGEAAVVRVEGEGAYLLDALRVLQAPALADIFNGVKTRLRLRTDYVLEPGQPYVRMVSTAFRSDPLDTCSTTFTCDLDCPGGLRFDGLGCPVCACATDEPLKLPNYEATTPLFGVAFGSSADKRAPGLIAGDFVFFGGQNDLFAPGMGFDEDRLVFDQLFEGSDPFTAPLPLDFMAAGNGKVSYGYFTANAPGEPDPRVLVPIITSSTTAFTTSGINCSTDASDDETCDAASSWTWERYLAVGKGDIASVADVVYAVRGTPVGRIEGVVLDAIYEPVPNGRVFLFADPDPTRDFADTREIIEASYRVRGVPGVLNVIDADVGLELVEDGDFSATMPPGTYLAVGTNEDLTATSAVTRLTVEEGRTTRYNPVVPPPARIRYRVTDGQGRLSPAKLTLVSVLADGTLADGDGLRRPAMGEGRLGAGIREMVHAATGEGVVPIEPGRYRIFASRGHEYALDTADVQAVSGQETVVTLQLVREVDSRGWVAGDFHIHQEPSHDSGMKMQDRLAAIVAEGIEVAVATDHDVQTDYRPTLNLMGLQHLLKTAVGVELTTVEMGHFVAFPLDYSDLTIPAHGAPDWTCENGPGFLRLLDEGMAPGKRGVRIMAHPRDGFFGYISQLGVNPIDLTRSNLARDKVDLTAFLTGGELLELEAGNPLLRVSTCAFDAMEVFNAKRFDLVRMPTNAEVITFDRCMTRIREVADGDYAALDAACPEAARGGPLATCTPGERFFDCKMKHRRALAYEMARQILVRTPEEQQAAWEHVFDPDADADACTPAAWTGELPPDVAVAPCLDHPGVLDDAMRWLDAGLRVTLTAASDSHSAKHESGTPRTNVRVNAEEPPDIDVDDVAKAVVDGEALPSYGPLVDVSVGGALPGHVARVTPGAPFTLDLRVQTASWFGVDRVEIYVSGRLQRVIEIDHGPEPVLDFEGPVELTAPDEDGFVLVVAMGTEPRNLMRPVMLDVPFGELQLNRTAILAFGSIPEFSAFFDAPPAVPDFYPVFPLAITNAILLDADGDGAWTRPGAGPAFCPRPCTPGDDSPCPGDQVCLDPEATCGYDIQGVCLTGPPGTEERYLGSVP